MIGRISTPTVSSDYRPHVDNLHQEKKVLINSKTNSFISVRNIDADFRVVGKELHLFREVKKNQLLANIVNVQFHKEQNERFSSLGVAVSANYNRLTTGKAKEHADVICNKHPMNQSDPSNQSERNNTLTQRGQEFISQLPDTPTGIDTTQYALGLLYGSDLKQGITDKVIRYQFEAISNIDSNMPVKNS
ncbi:hypothetical protein ABW286_11535 [Erwinia papayae]|uniref:Uncharacterized protein n=1 Tax=Erwinia papayae TaxID=206499 RepID=A0ABV3N1W7_9GAMM